MEKINLENFDVLRQLLKQAPPLSVFNPYSGAFDLIQEKYRELGEKVIKSGKVGVILVAGGQGTRLEYSGPKGCCPITAVKHKTLFHYFSGRLQAASLWAGRPLKMAVMTSRETQYETEDHFRVNQFFGLEEGQVSFFQQGDLPFLTPSGDLLLQPCNQFAMGPDGNGSSIQSFAESPISKQWIDVGIEHISYILVDNPLADPFDPYLIGAHASREAEVTMKCILRNSDQEKLGLVVEAEKKVRVIEYTEAPHEVWSAVDKNNQLTYSIANISLFCFSLPFFLKAASYVMPLHKVLKKCPYLDASGKVVQPKEPNAWKFERYIFDILDVAERVEVGLFPRERTFAPVKDKESLEKARSALSESDRHVMEALTNGKAPASCSEIDPQFYYPTDDIRAYWKGRKIPDVPYIKLK